VGPGPFFNFPFPSFLFLIAVLQGDAGPFFSLGRSRRDIFSFGRRIFLFPLPFPLFFPLPVLCQSDGHFFFGTGQWRKIKGENRGPGAPLFPLFPFLPSSRLRPAVTPLIRAPWPVQVTANEVEDGHEPPVPPFLPLPPSRCRGRSPVLPNIIPSEAKKGKRRKWRQELIIGSLSFFFSSPSPDKR